MSLSDPIADMLTRIRNACQNRSASVRMPSSKQKIAVLNILKKEGYISSYRVEKKDNKADVEVNLKYYDRLKPVIKKIIRISRPGLRNYIQARGLRPVRNNLGISIISTSQGVMTGRKAKNLNLGGEIICKVW